MPVKQGKDARGSYYQWGSGAKYHFNPESHASRVRAKNSAEEQGKATYSSGYKKKKKKK